MVRWMQAGLAESCCRLCVSLLAARLSGLVILCDTRLSVCVHSAWEKNKSNGVVHACIGKCKHGGIDACPQHAAVSLQHLHADSYLRPWEQI